jgi:adenylate cyclase
MPEPIRTLAAIMFSDIEGFTSMMQENEAKAMECRDRCREVINDEVINHRGLILQFYGDGTLCIFGSAIDAVNSAVAIQKSLFAEPRVPLRIGLTMGDIVYDDNGAYGDSINIASRIQSVSVPGAVLISDKINDEIKNQPSLSTISVGLFEFKNVKKPIEVFALTSETLVVPHQSEMSGKTASSVNSIAVLPFVNMSNDPDNEYFSDGITEEILNALTRVKGLFVTSRTSSFTFKGKQTDIREIGRALGVNAIIEGSVRKAGNRVRITAQMINSYDGYHLWSETFDRKLENIFEVQDEIAVKITNRLTEKIFPVKNNLNLIQHKTENIEAYNLYLQGLYLLSKHTPRDATKAIEYLRKSLALDPNYIPSHNILGSCYIYLAAIGYINSSEAYISTKECIEHCRKISKENAEIFMLEGCLKLFFEWDFPGAKTALEKAIELTPNSTHALHIYDYYLLITGDFQKAVEVMEKAVQLDPLAVNILDNLAISYNLSGRNKEALEIYDKILNLNPHSRVAINAKAFTLGILGRFDEGIKLIEDSQKLEGGRDKGLMELAVISGMAGYKEKSRVYLNRLLELSEKVKGVNLTMDIAMAYYFAGEIDSFFEYLYKAADKKLAGVLFIRYNPHYKKILTDERFRDFLKAYNLPGQL